jgi:membrane protein
MNKKQLAELFRSAFKDWQSDSMPIRAAALTFFIILPLPSLLLIAISIFSIFYGQAQALQVLVQIMSLVTGPAVAELFRQLLVNATSPFASLWTAVTLLAFSIGGAIGAFAVLRVTMDAIWRFKAVKPRRLSVRIKRWVGPFVLFSALGLIVIAASAIATALFNFIKAYSSNITVTFVSLTVAQVIFSFAVSTLLFAIIYKVIPLATVHWRDVTLASFVSGAAFTVTNYVIGIYVATFTVTTIIGTAEALFIILLWIFILNQIALFGAELSKVYALTVGSHAREHILITVETPQEQIINA